jgi:hypothetical protein
VQSCESSKKHSFVHDITIASPCPANWEAMTGDARVRFCGQCKLNVYNLSEMTENDAEKLIVEHEGRLCVRLYRRADGTVLTKDCPVGFMARMKSYTRKTCAAVAAVGAVLAAYVIAKDSQKSFDQSVRAKYHEIDAKIRCSSGYSNAAGGVSAPEFGQRIYQGDAPRPVGGNVEVGRRRADTQPMAGSLIPLPIDDGNKTK